MLGAFEPLEEGQEEPKWQASIGWRAQRSDRHFRGIHEEPNRQAEGSEVVNDLHLLDIGIRYNFSPRTSVSIGIPYLMATRSSPIRGANREVIGRSISQARGLGDITVVGRRLLVDPATHPKGNVSLGLGIKLPTGENNVIDQRTRFTNGQLVTTLETVDQSIQPGDGGLGFVADVGAFRQFGPEGRFAVYGSGTYLINPEGTSGVHTFRGGAEEIMSIADQYLARIGVQAAPASWHGIGVGLGGRIEGIPVSDLFGSSEGFRRPGYAVSVEPSFTWSKGKRSFSLAVPIAIQRNRQRSVPDMIEGDGIGDAAFADYVVLLGYWQRF